MSTRQTFARIALGGLAAAEGTLALQRWQERREVYDQAARRAATLHRPLVVIGDPDAGAHTRLFRAYGCGDLCVDLRGCPLCEVVKVADLAAGPVPDVADDTAVVFVSCVLEYIGDAAAAVRELRRMAATPSPAGPTPARRRASGTPSATCRCRATTTMLATGERSEIAQSPADSQRISRGVGDCPPA